MELRRTRNATALLWLSALMALAILPTTWGAIPARAAGRVYVVPGGAGARTGASWADAKDLAPALGAAVSGDELWVASGVYRPTTPVGRDATFLLKAGVAVYGGFAGSETARGQRDWTTRVVTLTGDLQGNDQPGFVNNGDNSYHVVTGASGATLDGVTIIGGNADDDVIPGGCGGGMYNGGASPTLRNVVLSGNSATFGGGMCNNSGSNPRLTGVTLKGNSAANGGGGMHNVASSPTLTNVVLSGNSAGYGGGISNDVSGPKLANVALSGNIAAYGGGMYSFGGGSIVLTNVTLSGNRATTGGGGGGMANYGTSPQIRNTIIWGNNTQMHNGDGAAPSLSYSLVQDGIPARAIDGGGNLSSDPLFVAAVPAAPSSGGDLRPRRASPAVDVASVALLPEDSADLDGDGNTAEALPLDLLGSPRQLDIPGVGTSALDMGAYEAPLPWVEAITRRGASPTRAASVDFAVTFTTPVTGVDAADFALVKTGGQSSAAILGVMGSSATYTVTVNTVAGATGTLRLELRDNDTIVTSDAPIVPLGGSGASNGDYLTGEVYTVDRLPPALGLTTPAPINLANRAAYPVGGTCTAGDGTVTVGVGGLTTSAGCAGGSFSATLDASGLADAGAIQVSASQTDGVGNTGQASAATVKDTLVPGVTILSAVAATTNVSPITVTVTFSEDVSGFTLADLALTNAVAGNLGGGGAVYTLALTPTADGPVGVTISAGAAHDAGANPSTASAPFGRVYDSHPPFGLGLGPRQAPVACATGYTFTVVLSDNLGLDPTSLGSGDVTVSGPGGFTAQATLVAQRTEADGTTLATLTIPAPGGSWDEADDGVYVVRLVAGALRDRAGNLSLAADVGSFRSAILPPIYLPSILRLVPPAT